MTQKLPAARNESVAVQEIENETLIYDFEIDKAYCLNETSSIVYRHCDGKTSFEELKRRYRYSDDLIYLALEGLQKTNLIKGEKINHFAGMSRREAIRKVGFGTLIALPVISSLAAPSAVGAASTCRASGQSCTFSNFTQSNCCTNLRCQNTNACTGCLTGGSTYANCAAPGGETPGNQAVCTTTCNNDTRKNLCCNGGQAFASFSTVSNDYTCRCP